MELYLYVFYTPYSGTRAFITGMCNLFKLRAALKNTKIVAGRTQALEPNDLNTMMSLAINFNLTFT
jgi:hypothetical protein